MGHRDLIPCSGLNVKLGSLFCIECDDFVHDTTVDSLFHASVLSVEEKDTNFQGQCIDDCGGLSHIDSQLRREEEKHIVLGYRRLETLPH